MREHGRPARPAVVPPPQRVPACRAAFRSEMPDAYRPGRSRYGAVTNVLAVVAVVDLVGEHGDLAFDPHVPALVSTRAPAWDDVFETLRVGARLPRPLTGLPRFNPPMERRLPMAGEASQRDGRRVPVARRDVDSGRVPAQRTLGRLWRRHSLVRLSAPYIERWSRQLQGLPMNARRTSISSCLRGYRRR